MQADALVRCAGNVDAKYLKLTDHTGGDAKKDSADAIIYPGGIHAELRVPWNKRILITNDVATGEGSYFVVNLVDKKGELAALKKGTALVTAPYAQASQFKTDNVMPKTFLKWSVERLGNTICTKEGSEGEGKWSGDYL